jgi:hypothetical protein
MAEADFPLSINRRRLLASGAAVATAATLVSVTRREEEFQESKTWRRAPVREATDDPAEMLGTAVHLASNS